MISLYKKLLDIPYITYKVTYNRLFYTYELLFKYYLS